MKNLLRLLSYILVATVTAAATLMLCGGPVPPVEQSKLDQLEDLLVECYIGDVDQTAIEDAAATAMVNALGDRWSYYIPAAEYDAYLERMANAYVGIGVTIQLTDSENGFLVIKVNEGGPADQAGLLAGDIMIAVDGTDVRGMDGSQVGDLVRGEAGTQVELTVLRSGSELTITATRNHVRVPVATATMLEGNVGLVTIANFDARCADETIAAMEQLLDQGAAALIFDVRNNPGGYASELVKVLDYLLPEGELFRTVDYAGKVDVDMSDAACLEGVPLVVLVNSESYSAAEFFAAALVDYDAAVVVGEKTCGKGYFQVTMELNDGSAVGLSIGEYFTPKGENLAGVGVTPDVEVAVDEETFAAIYAGTLDPMEDPQILAALAQLEK